MAAEPWQPTAALVRGALGSAVLVLPAVAFGRPDLLVLAVPLLVPTVLMLVRRPRAKPGYATWLVHPELREGEGTMVRARVSGADEVEHAVLALAPHRWLGFDRFRGVSSVHLDPPASTATVDVPVRSLRWGVRQVGQGLAAATSGWGGYRHGPEHTDSLTLTTLPLPGRFDSRAPTPHPVGLVGLNPSTRSGDGSEFAGIRPFTPGDRLRRVHWPVSLRTGSLHVTTAVAEQDSNVVLVVDALTDIGAGDDRPSSLDTGVRAAGAVAEHHLRRGDRVGLRVLGPERRNTVHSGSGNRHLRRLLDALARVVPAHAPHLDVTRMQFGIGAGAVVVVLSPMLSPEVVSVPVTLASRGLTVVVVDTLPDGLAGVPDRRLRLAWRIRLLEREGALRRVAAAGVPVVAWRGPGTLDDVLRRLARRSTQPRTVRR